LVHYFDFDFVAVAWAVTIMATGEITAVVKSVPTTTVAFQVGPMEY